MIFPAEGTRKFFVLSDVESRGAITSTTTCIRVQNGGTRSHPSRGNLSQKAVNSTGAVNIYRHRRAQTLKRPNSSITAITLPLPIDRAHHNSSVTRQSPSIGSSTRLMSGFI